MLTAKIVGWDGKSNPIVRLVADCGCEWTPKGERREFCTASLRGACESGGSNATVRA